MSTWREHAAPIISATIKRVGKGDIKALRKALREAYPYDERINHPYKIWCSEVNNQLFPVALKTKERADSKTIDMFD